MKTKNLLFIPVVLLLLFACQKEETTENLETLLKSGEIVAGDVTIESALNEANYEAELFSQSEQWLRILAKYKKWNKKFLDGKHNNRYTDGTFPEVTIDTAEAGYPVTILIDYGDSTVLHNGHVISGTLSVEITAKRNTDGAQRIITYNGCKIDSITVTGTEKETFNGNNETTRKTTVDTDVTFTLDDGTTILRKGQTVHEWLEGLATLQDHSDDKILKTGLLTVSSSTGDEWTKSISEPLIRLGDCRNYVQGVVEYLLNNTVVAVLDYGDGTCDTTATLTVGNEQIEITFEGKKAKANHKGKGK